MEIFCELFNKKCVIILFCLHFVLCASKRLPKNDVYELCEKIGFTAELHEVVTEDGYILNIFRIKSRTGLAMEDREPVLLQHGLIGSCEHYLHAGNQSLAMMLMDHGFDVWLGNSRGNFHSRRHVTMNPDKDKEFWFFTLDHLAEYDLPASIDYILNVTGRQNLSYVGHSQGSETLMGMGAARPEYNKKIKISVNMAPAVSLKYNQHPLLLISRVVLQILQELVKLIGVFEIEPVFQTKIMNNVFQGMCGENVDYRKNCRPLIDFLSNSDNSLLNYNLVPEIFTTTPSGISVYQAFHFAQMYATGNFQKYDWGLELNMKKYNSTTPPEYDWSKITFPVALLYGSSDSLVNPRDVEYIAKKIPNVVELYKVPENRFNHLDFIWGTDVIPLLYNKVVDILNKYRNL